MTPTASATATATATPTATATNTAVPTVDHFVITGLADPSIVGVGSPFAVTAQDSSNAVITGYDGTVTFTSSDPAAGLPANYTFTLGDGGSHNFTVTFNTAGPQSVTVADTVVGSATGMAAVTVNP